MAKKQQPGWQFKFTFGLSIVMFFLVIAYFVQSFHAVREIKPVSVAAERISKSSAEPLSNSELTPVTEAEKKGVGDH
jgi:hypothetical protein